MEYIELGSAPAEESCAQVGSEDYERAARRECAVYKRMLERLFPIPEGFTCRYTVRRFPHDFGSYFEVCIGFSARDSNGFSSAPVDFAYRVERETPDRWDAIAQYELAWYERRQAYEAAVREGRLKPEEVPDRYRAAHPPQLAPEAAFHELLAAYPL